MSIVQVELVSIDAGILCKPSDGYSKTANVDIGNLQKVGEIGKNGLPHSTQKFPLGAPVSRMFVYKGDVFEMKS